MKVADNLDRHKISDEFEFQQDHTIHFGVMHQLFVTAAPAGPGNSVDFNFSRVKAPVNALHCGVLLFGETQLKAPLKSRQVNVKILAGVKTWNQKPGNYTALRG